MAEKIPPQEKLDAAITTAAIATAAVVAAILTAIVIQLMT